VKSERANPGGSIKDRIALAMVEDAENRARCAGRHDHRADQRQHRHRPGDGRGGQGLQTDPGHARIDVARAARLMLAYGATFDLTPRSSA
jgi:cysteine synthase A